jgi:para-nitrobenzyl esterase
MERAMRLTRWMGVGLLLASGSLWAQSALVRTPSGVLAGLRQDGVAAYLGIPYAQPPVGALRWRAPQGGVVWDGIRPAVEYGPLCPQNLDIVVGPRPRVAEDCLTLNVWTPAGKPAHPLPVLVWLHGGGYFQGGASQWPTDGAALAARGAVVVSVNFRLGALGFFAHPALSAEAARDGSDDGTGVARSGNYGLLDQLAALAWVQATIARFGGDPGNVTLMGQSSGATTATTRRRARASHARRRARRRS